MRPTIILAALPLTLSPGLALAHIGHLGAVAGHDHWVAGAAIGAAVAVAAWGAWKGRKDKDAEAGKDGADKDGAEDEGDEVTA
ncbi:DUF6732 family protein [Pseudoroseicyclus sp. CXY001]|uniref:DUF6732 family protein n=1 Tax=Pseudoroseicyclus sp. CXY001 TaxID=3242492 RepID=UPI0035715DA5